MRMGIIPNAIQKFPLLGCVWYKELLTIGALFLQVAAVSEEKWIVVTTINYPTPQLRKLADVPGWHLVVVGDKKTPEDWHLENCEYLSPSRQLELGYELAKALPWNHYARKNIGYLYAIEHGAKIIYDTDDDNEPISGLNPVLEEDILPGLIASGDVVNIYEYFGHPAIWPRGLPLDEIFNQDGLTLSPPVFCKVGIEQGVVNGSPDVDAIFRLTQNRLIEFEATSPCYLPEGLFSPSNSQNTFFHSDAFLALYVPSQISQRVADIWRGYIAQKILWKLGCKLVISGPNAVQDRNPHCFYQDFLQEQELYLNSKNLIQFLKEWNFSDREIFQETEALFLGLIEKGFLQNREISLVSLWLQDLNKIKSKEQL